MFYFIELIAVCLILWVIANLVHYIALKAKTVDDTEFEGSMFFLLSNHWHKTDEKLKETKGKKGVSK